MVLNNGYNISVMIPSDLDLWPWKSIGFQILLRTKYVPSLVKIHWRMLILECLQGCYGRTDGSVTISLRNFVGEGIINLLLGFRVQWCLTSLSTILQSWRSILLVDSRINILQWILTKLGTYIVLRRVWNPIDFQGQGVKFLLHNILVNTRIDILQWRLQCKYVPSLVKIH
jgi:hypothetical protein